MFIIYNKYSQLPISRTRKGPGKVSDLSEIQKIMQIIHCDAQRELNGTQMWNYATINNIIYCI